MKKLVLWMLLTMASSQCFSQTIMDATIFKKTNLRTKQELERRENIVTVIAFKPSTILVNGNTYKIIKKISEEENDGVPLSDFFGIDPEGDAVEIMITAKNGVCVIQFIYGDISYLFSGTIR